MSRLKKVHILLIMVPLAFVTFSNLMGAEKPALYGRVWLVVPSGKEPLADATVKIVSPDKGETVQKTYTDASGDYAFYDVKPGEYVLVISWGQTLLNAQAIEVLSKPTKVPEMLVGASRQSQQILPPNEERPTNGPVRAFLKLKSLFCRKKSEMGNDEVYMIVLERKPDGSTSEKRIPEGGRGYWRIRKSLRNIPALMDINLWRGEIPQAEKVDIEVIFMEADSGLRGKHQKLGSFTIEMRNDTGILRKSIKHDELTSFIEISSTGGSDDSRNSYEFEMTGEGSIYHGDLQIIQVQYQRK